MSINKEATMIERSVETPSSYLLKSMSWSDWGIESFEMRNGNDAVLWEEMPDCEYIQDQIANFVWFLCTPNVDQEAFEDMLENFCHEWSLDYESVLQNIRRIP